MTYTAPMPVPPFARVSRPSATELRERGLIEREVQFLRASPPPYTHSRKCGRWCIACATAMFIFLWAFCVKGLLEVWQAVVFGLLTLFMAFRMHRDRLPSAPTRAAAK